MKRTVTVIGAGFSGLTTAYYLVKAGIPARVIEKQDRVGGLLGTRRQAHGLVESAANGLINSVQLESLCADIGVTLLPLLPQSRARYFWRDKIRRWPLNASESLRLGAGLMRNLGNWRPHTGESLSGWGARLLGPAAVNYALTPAMGGIYASDAELLSASLIFNRKGLGLEYSGNHQTAQAAKPTIRGTVSPRGGMQELVDGLRHYLETHGVALELNHTAQLEPKTPTAICTSAPHASNLLAEQAPEISQRLSQIELLPIVTATCFYEHSARQPQGFGCLFPRNSEIRALGVLFNDCLFAGRSQLRSGTLRSETPHSETLHSETLRSETLRSETLRSETLRSETWIMGGASDRTAVHLGDGELESILRANHAKLVGADEPLLSFHATRWPQALPHYTLALERNLTTLPALPGHLVLAGNYLGKIGLAKLLERAQQVAIQLKEHAQK